MTYNDSSYGDFWRDLGSHASNLAGSHVAQQTDIKRYSNNTLFQFQYLHFKGSRGW